MTTPRRLTYSEYINDQAVVEALRMPAPPAPAPADWPETPPGWTPADDWPAGARWAHDEVLFIRTHQAFEVWFAEIIHEASSVVRDVVEMLESAGARVPRVDLGDREARLADMPEARLPLEDPSWPETGRVVGGAVEREPRLAEVFGQVHRPAVFEQDIRMPPGLGEREDFNRGLLLWTRRLRRASSALLCTLPFFDVLETMTPGEFLRFRDRLQPASGFGSGQFREIEYLLGMRELNRRKLRPAEGEGPAEGMLRPTEATPSVQRDTSFAVTLTAWGRARVERRALGHSVRDVVYALLSAAYKAGQREGGPEAHLVDMRRPRVDAFVAGCLEALLRDHYRGSPGGLDDAGLHALQAHAEALSHALAHAETVAAALIAGVPAQERFTLFLEAALELDGALLRWRDRHIRFVEAMIGGRVGTGGGGMRYLRGTVGPQRPIHVTHGLPCLWQARSYLQRSTGQPA